MPGKKNIANNSDAVIIHAIIARPDGEEPFVYAREIPDIICLGATVEIALSSFYKELYDYAQEYDENYSNAPNRKEHLPYIKKILALGSPDRVSDMVVCIDGKE